MFVDGALQRAQFSTPHGAVLRAALLQCARCRPVLRRRCWMRLDGQRRRGLRAGTRLNGARGDQVLHDRAARTAPRPHCELDLHRPRVPASRGHLLSARAGACRPRRAAAHHRAARERRPARLGRERRSSTSRCAPTPCSITAGCRICARYGHLLRHAHRRTSANAPPIGCAASRWAASLALHHR